MAEIQREDVERTYKRTRDTAQTLSDDEAMTAKLNLLNELIVQDILLAKAGQLKLEVAPADSTPPSPTRRRTSPTKHSSRELTRRSLTPIDMREGLRRELLAQKVIDQEVGSESRRQRSDVTAFFTLNSRSSICPRSRIITSRKSSSRQRRTNR